MTKVIALIKCDKTINISQANIVPIVPGAIGNRPRPPKVAKK